MQIKKSIKLIESIIFKLCYNSGDQICLAPAGFLYLYAKVPCMGVEAVRKASLERADKCYLFNHLMCVTFSKSQ